jgi:hypothetical protein
VGSGRWAVGGGDSKDCRAVFFTTEEHGMTRIIARGAGGSKKPRFGAEHL